jgi:UDP-N-acetylglucosamine 4-epimerase
MHMTTFQTVREQLSAAPRRWLVTGGAGFIGSHLVEHLLRLGQRVTVLDSFATGHRSNLEDVRQKVAGKGSLEVIEGDIRDREACRRACSQADHVLHQAALGSVPRSIQDPLASHASNTDGFVHMLVAARDAGVKSFVYASSSSVYGDAAALPKVEDQIGRPLSPYAATKAANESYGYAFALAYGLRVIGLRYFNVFGPRQDPNGPYAAVMPLWFKALLTGAEVAIHGDGETSRDFCYVENAVQANILAACSEGQEANAQVYNVACGSRTTLNELFDLIREQVVRFQPAANAARPRYGPFRAGDVRHSLADIGRARRLLGYEPSHDIRAGLTAAAAWYAASAAP